MCKNFVLRADYFRGIGLKLRKRRDCGNCVLSAYCVSGIG